MRKPDNVVWSWQCWLLGFCRTEYHYNAVCWTLCLGPLTLRWHWR